MKLKVVSAYNDGHGLIYPVGTVLEVDAASARWFTADSPGSFQIIPEEPPVPPDEPPADKMVKRARRK